MSGSIWESGENYDIGGESLNLREFGEPFLTHALRSGGPDIDPDRPVLVDFGCWSGRHLRLLERVAERCADPVRDADGPTRGSDVRRQIIGVDEHFAEGLRIEEARRTHPDFQILDTGLASTGLAASSVDGAICWRVLHNLTALGELPRALAEIRRVMKAGAPIVVAVRRADSAWMNDSAPTPILYRTFSPLSEREDLYFSEAACYATFSFFGFDVVFVAKAIVEGEIVAGEVVENDYWVLALMCTKRRVGEREHGERVSHPQREVMNPPPWPRTSDEWDAWGNERRRARRRAIGAPDQ